MGTSLKMYATFMLGSEVPRVGPLGAMDGGRCGTQVNYRTKRFFMQVQTVDKLLDFVA